MYPRGTVRESVEQELELRADGRVRREVAVGSAAPVTAERQQMLALRRFEPQGGGDAPQGGRGRADVTCLLEPRVPLGADAGERGNLFPPEPGRSPPRAAGQADVLGSQAGPPAAEKGGNLT